MTGRIYRETERDNGNQFGRPGRKPFLWLQGIMDEEMEFLNNVLHAPRLQTSSFLFSPVRLPGIPLLRQTPAPCPLRKTGR